MFLLVVQCANTCPIEVQASQKSRMGAVCSIARKPMTMCPGSAKTMEVTCMHAAAAPGCDSYSLHSFVTYGLQSSTLPPCSRSFQSLEALDAHRDTCAQKLVKNKGATEVLHRVNQMQMVCASRFARTRLFVSEAKLIHPCHGRSTAMVKRTAQKSALAESARP